MSKKSKSYDDVVNDDPNHVLGLIDDGLKVTTPGDVMLDDISSSPLKDVKRKDVISIEQRSDGSHRVRLIFQGDPGRTIQSYKESTDITKILERHLRQGVIPPMPESEFQSFVGLPDYQTCLNTVIKAQDLFSQLPISIKAHFDNDPELLMKAVEDPSRRNELIELGVFKPNDENVVDKTVQDMNKNASATKEPS